MSAGQGFGRAAPRMIVGRGARTVEDLVLADIEALLPASVSDVALLARPIVVVVPSRSLRLHLAWRLVERRGRAVAGVRIITLHGLAAEILGRWGERPPVGAPLLPVLVQRFARREDVLRASLDPLQDGYAVLIGSVRDLLDAGFEPSHADALDQLLAERGKGVEEARARALIRTAAAVALALEEIGRGVGAQVLRRATELLRTDPERALPARAILIHGFADATGVATDLIETLLRQHGASIYLDRPPDPAEPSQLDPGARFGERFVSRLQGVVRPEPRDAPVLPPEVRESFRAPGISAEAREVARRIRRLLAAGVPPERIGVVAREVGPYGPALQVHLTRLGIPFSGVAATGSRDASGRRSAALAELLRLGSEAPTDLWLSAWGGRVPFDVRLAFHVCGAPRLRDAAALDVDAFVDEEDHLPLPVRRGLVEVPPDDEQENGGRTVAARRKVSGERLRRTVARAFGAAERLAQWPSAAPLAEHLARLRGLLREELGWTRATPGEALAAAAFTRLSQQLPRTFDLSREEFFLLVRRELAGAAGTPLGGQGGGVQVLSVIEARGRTFTHLFVVGLNRDVFPRPVSEDPLLPDRLRLALATLLPDIPIKRTGFDEERFLFAQLLSSARQVTISWLACDDDGKARPPSPLVERLRLRSSAEEPPLVGAALALGPPDDPRPAFEHAVLAGLHGSRDQFGAVLPIACAEAVGEGAVSEAQRLLAAARLAVLDELDPDRRTAEGRARWGSLGPYFGFVGAVGPGRDPRRDGPAITTAESLAGCPWQVFLRRVLRVEPPPDALATVPGLDPLLVGQAVHAVLDGIVREAAPKLPGTLDDALASPPVVVPWPESEVFERVLQNVCAGVAREAGLALPGLGRVLAEQARPFLAVARKLAWKGDRAAIGGVEVEGAVRVADAAGARRALSFRADRVDESDGAVLLTDFKTGRPFSKAVGADTRRGHFLRAVREGRALQGVGYGAAVQGRFARGRYLFLKPDLEDDRRVFEVAPEDTEFAAAFTSVVRAVLQAWDLGALFPRLEEASRPVEPRRCSMCEVRDACLRGDSGARRRLASWAERHAEKGTRSPAEGALLSVWRLGVEGGGRDGAEEEG